jgi:hypothetical protein
MDDVLFHVEGRLMDLWLVDMSDEPDNARTFQLTGFNVYDVTK